LSGAIYLSLGSGDTLGGISVDDLDIVYFDGANWSMFFDASDVGIAEGGTDQDVNDFQIVDADTILLTFEDPLTLGSLAIDPWDIVRFDATSLGTNTAGTFSLYFDGNDVGLDDTTNEVIDALDILSDGRVLISTKGDFSVPGLTGKDEDLLVFTPTMLGETTSGSWAIYFDGSIAALGLGNTAEDIDALEIAANGSIYLSTADAFAVTGVSGEDEDVFVCTPTYTGTAVTSCTYSSTLFFDGSAYNLSANDVDALNLPLQFAWSGQAHFASYNFAPPPQSSQTYTSQPDGANGQDTFIASKSATTNYGTDVGVRIGESNNSTNDLYRTLIKFDLSSIPANATITSATLSLWTANDFSDNNRTIRVYRLKTAFNELEATWNKASASLSWQSPGASGANDRESTDIGSLQILANESLSIEKQISIAPAKIQELVNATFTNNGLIIVADTELNDRFNYKSSDTTTTSNRPKLVIQYTVSTPTPTASQTPTSTKTFTPTQTSTVVGTNTPTPTSGPSPTSTRTATATPTATGSVTFTPTPTQMPSGPITILYMYDPLNRLTEANYSNNDYYHYTYDAVGNRKTQERRVSGVITSDSYTYDFANRIADVNDAPYTWDANGNLRNDGVNIYSYDLANRLVTLTGSASASYSYNGLSDRIQETRNGQTTIFTMDYAIGLTQALSDGTNNYIYGVDRIAQTQGTATEYFLGDALGSVRQLTDNSGAINYASAYDPYGVVTSSLGSSQSAYGYTGEYSGDYNQLVYLRSRMYDPLSGRFLTKDSWQGDYNRPLSLNRWMYVEGNPVNYTDPTGLVKCPWNPALECSRDQVIAYYLQGLYGLFGISSGTNVNIPTVGEIHTAGTPSRMFFERTGPGLATVGDTGLSFMPGYNEINAAFGYNQITGYGYTSEERLWMSLWGVFGLGDCFPGLRFAPDGVGGGALPGAKRYLINGKWETAPAKIPVKFGYTGKLQKYINKIPGASYLLDESWGLKGLVSSETFEKGSWQAQALEAMSNSSEINFIVDGMDIMRFPVEAIKPAYGKGIYIATHWEMDQILTRGYLDKLHLWDSGVEITGIMRLEWIKRWKIIRDIQ